VLLGCLCPRLRAGFAPAFFCLPVLTRPGGRVGYASGRSPWTTCLQFVYDGDGDIPEGDGDMPESDGDSSEGDGDSSEGDGDSSEGDGDSSEGDGDSSEGGVRPGLTGLSVLSFAHGCAFTWAGGHVVKEGHSRGRGCLNWMCAFSPPFLLLRCELHGYLSARKRQGSHSYLSPFHHTGPKETHGTRWTPRWTSAACV
jgi:hypothetical protein